MINIEDIKLSDQFLAEYKELGGSLLGTKAIRITCYFNTYDDGDCIDLYIINPECSDPEDYVISDLSTTSMNFSCRKLDWDWKENSKELLHIRQCVLDDGEIWSYWDSTKETLFKKIMSIAESIKIIEVNEFH